MGLETNYDYFMKADLTAYRDQWIAIVDCRVVRAGHSARKVYEEVCKQFPKKRPLLAKIPGPRIMIL
ncbi:MAG: succinyl-CoA synthetase subunit alpha [Candidatus Aenigmarchaeota archaeon]|nr:succinyl-CoA synthetase subunit alpha [Candidatus Aenigmarchaeota archaeon]